MDTTDYNKIMEFIEKNFIGQIMIVKIHGHVGDELIYKGRLEDAEYETEDKSLVKRVPVNFEGDIRLKFENLEAILSGYQLQLKTVYDYDLPPNPVSLGYLLGNGLDKAILLHLEKQ